MDFLSASRHTRKFMGFALIVFTVMIAGPAARGLQRNSGANPLVDLVKHCWICSVHCHQYCNRASKHRVLMESPFRDDQRGWNGHRDFYDPSSDRRERRNPDLGRNVVRSRLLYAGEVGDLVLRR